MQEIFGKEYYIDLDAITEVCAFKTEDNSIKTEDNSIKTEDDSEKDVAVNNYSQTLEINIFKYEIIKMCIDRVFSEYDVTDEQDKLFNRQNESTSFILAFNTLIKK